jgi:hypothetical protein
VSHQPTVVDVRVLGHSPPFAVVAHFNIDDRPASRTKAFGDLFGLMLRPGACSLTDGFLQDFRGEATHSFCRSILINWLIRPVRRIGEHVGPVASHFAVVAVLTRVCKKYPASIVLWCPQLARAAGARFWSPLLGYACHFLLLLGQ